MPTEGRDRFFGVEHTAGLRSLDIWDTAYCSPAEAFGVFRDGIQKSFMPWTADLTSIENFYARIETSALDQATVSRIEVSPHVTGRTAVDIQRSNAELVHLLFQLRGDIVVEQGGNAVTVRSGELSVFRSDVPIKITQQAGCLHGALIIGFPRALVAQTLKDERQYTNIAVRRDRRSDPLFATARYLQDQFLSCSEAELNALATACLTLLPTAIGACSDDGRDNVGRHTSNLLFAKLAQEVRDELSNSRLTPQLAADRCGISVRYVHKIFAERGTTFGEFVRNSRLEKICEALSGKSCREENIQELATRWGFEELSTFNRAFKKRLNCTPSQFRLRRGTSAID